MWKSGQVSYLSCKGSNKESADGEQGQLPAPVTVRVVALMSYLLFISISRDSRYDSARTQEGLLKSEQTILFKGSFQCKATIYHAPGRGRKNAIMLPLLCKANAWLRFDEVIWLLNSILEKKWLRIYWVQLTERETGDKISWVKIFSAWK